MTLADLQTAFAAYGPIVAPLILMLEAVFIVGLFTPGLAALILIGFSLKGAALLQATMLCWFAVVAADSAGFAVGAAAEGRWGQTLHRRPRGNAALAFLKQSGALIFFYPFLPSMRMVVPAAAALAGMSRAQWRRTACVAAALYVGTGVGLGRLADRLAHSLDQTSQAAALIAAPVAIWTVAAVIGRRRRHVPPERPPSERDSSERKSSRQKD